MIVEYPVNTIIVIMMAMVAVTVSSWVSLSKTLERLPFLNNVQRNWKIGVASVLSVWFLIRVFVALYPPSGKPLEAPLVIGFLVVGLLIGIIPFAVSSTFRRVVYNVPERWLVGIHSIRIFGFLFLALADMKLLPPEFALPAGYGDMLVGLLSLLVVYRLSRQKPYTRTLVIAWNILGLIDFVAALTTGILFIGPFVNHLVTLGISPLYLNYVLIIPTFGVPLFTVLHLYSLIQMSSLRRTQLVEAAFVKE